MKKKGFNISKSRESFFQTHGLTSGKTFLFILTTSIQFSLKTKIIHYIEINRYKKTVLRLLKYSHSLQNIIHNIQKKGKVGSMEGLSKRESHI
jgi:hypothetical protein